MRTHAKALILPAVVLVLLSTGLGLGLAFRPEGWGTWFTWVLVGLFVVLVLWACVLPFLRWWTDTYTVTDRRIVTRKGILNRTGHDVPLRRINNVNYEKSITDRLLGCGTLILETAAGQPLVLPDVPRVESVHRSINDLLFAQGGPVLEDGTAAHHDD